jgi:hypothetical protein
MPKSEERICYVLEVIWLGIDGAEEPTLFGPFDTLEAAEQYIEEVFGINPIQANILYVNRV